MFWQRGQYLIASHCIALADLQKVQILVIHVKFDIHVVLSRIKLALTMKHKRLLIQLVLSIILQVVYGYPSGSNLEDIFNDTEFQPVYDPYYYDSIERKFEKEEYTGDIFTNFLEPHHNQSEVHNCHLEF